MRVKERTKARQKHLFVDDPTLRDDRTGQQFCLCGLPAENEAHTWDGRKDAR